MPKPGSKLPWIAPCVFSSFFLLTGPLFASSILPRDVDRAKTMGQGRAGQEAKENKTAQAETKVEITVTAPRVEIPLKKNPAATTVVETPILRTMPRTIAIDEVMKLVPGVRVDNQADGERVHLSIRGEGILTERGTRGIRTIVDGSTLAGSVSRA